MMRGAALVLTLTVLAGCASLEPEPCTPEWVDWQTDQILDPFVHTYRNEISTLRSFSGDIENPGMITAFRMAGLADDLVRMAEDFSETVVPEAQAALAQCTQEPETARQLLVSMLERENVEPDVIAWVTALGLVFEQLNARTIESSAS